MPDDARDRYTARLIAPRIYRLADRDDDGRRISASATPPNLSDTAFSMTIAPPPPSSRPACVAPIPATVYRRADGRDDAGAASVGDCVAAATSSPDTHHDDGVPSSVLRPTTSVGRFVSLAETASADGRAASAGDEVPAVDATHAVFDEVGNRTTARCLAACVLTSVTVAVRHARACLSASRTHAIRVPEQPSVSAHSPALFPPQFIGWSLNPLT